MGYLAGRRSAAAFQQSIRCARSTAYTPSAVRDNIASIPSMAFPLTSPTLCYPLSPQKLYRTQGASAITLAAVLVVQLPIRHWPLARAMSGRAAHLAAEKGACHITPARCAVQVRDAVMTVRRIACDSLSCRDHKGTVGEDADSLHRRVVSRPPAYFPMWYNFCPTRG